MPEAQQEKAAGTAKRIRRKSGSTRLNVTPDALLNTSVSIFLALVTAGVTIGVAIYQQRSTRQPEPSVPISTIQQRPDDQMPMGADAGTTGSQAKPSANVRPTQPRSAEDPVNPLHSTKAHLNGQHSSEQPHARRELLTAGETLVDIGVLLLDASGTPAASLSEEVARRFGGTAALFTREFVESGLYHEVLAGVTKPLITLEVGRRARAVLLGTLSVSTRKDFLDGELNVVTITCEAKLYLAREQFRYHALSVTGEGAEYAGERARSKAATELAQRLGQQVSAHLYK